MGAMEQIATDVADLRDLSCLALSNPCIRSGGQRYLAALGLLEICFFFFVSGKVI
jgi:hypothetical protein